MPDTLKLDLDAIAPKKGLVTLNGRDYEVSPPKMRTTVEIIKLINEFSELQKEKDVSGAVEGGISRAAELMERFVKVLSPIMPALKEDPDLDLEFEQAQRLLRFVFEMAQNPESAALAEEGIPEKKTSAQSGSSDSLPTSSESSPDIP